MKQKIFLFTLAVLPLFVHAQLKVKIDGIYYNLSGVSATVTRDGDSSTGYTYYREDSYSIPSTVTYQGLNYTVTGMGGSAFTGSSASSIILPSTIKSIGQQAFSYCTKLTSIDLGEVERMGGYAFFSCTSLASILIPSSMKSFDEIYSPFALCSLLREIIYLPTTAPSNWTATTMTYVPDLQSYSSPKYSMNDAHIIEMITFDKKEFEYTGETPTTTWTNNVNGYTASLSMPTLSSKVGSHIEWIPVTFTKGDKSFETLVAYRYTIKPIPLKVKVMDAKREYGEENPEFTVTITGFLGNEDENVLTTKPTASTTATKSSSVGEYPINISGGEATNYEFVYESGVLTVTKAPLSAKVNNATKLYGAQNPTFTIDYYGLKNEETEPEWTTQPIFTTDATQGSDIGQYVVNALNGVPMNYDLGEIGSGTLSITPAPLTIKANDAVRQYYSDDPIFSYTCNGFVNGENESVLSTKPSFSTSAIKMSNVGTYEIKPSGAVSQNYSISYVNGTLNITPRTLMASVGNYERLYGEENPEFVVKYDGFVGNDNENILSKKPVAKTEATKTSDVGTYKIEVTDGYADNYTFSYTSGILTVNKAEQSIDWEQDLNGLKVGDQVELKAKVTSGLPITYTVENNKLAEIYTAGEKSFLDCKAEGEFVIRAVQNGNNNYYSSPRATKTVSIVAKTGDGPVTPAPNGECATPTIIAMGNKIRFECETPGAEFTSYLTTSEEFTGSEMEVSNKDLVFTLTVYATAPDYDRSQPATMKFVVKKTDVNGDGRVDVADIATIISEMAAQARAAKEEAAE